MEAEILLKNFTQNTDNFGHAQRAEITLKDYEDYILNNTLTNHLKKLGLSPKGKVLEVGSSIGTTSFALAMFREVESVKCIEPELEAHQLSIGVQKHYDQYNKIHFLNISAEDLGTDTLYDFIICNTVLEHTKNPREIFLKLLDLLSENGRLYVTTPNYSIPYEPHIRLFYFLPWLSKNNIRFLAKLFKKNYRFVEHLYLLKYSELVGWIDPKKFVLKNIFERKVQMNLFYGSRAKMLMQIRIFKKISLALIKTTKIYPSIEVIIERKKN